MGTCVNAANLAQTRRSMSLTNDPKVLEFLLRNQIRARDTGHKILVPDHTTPVNHYPGGYEKVYTLEITESRLRALVDLELAVVNTLRKNGNLDVHLSLIKELELERQFRESNEVAKNAYESYELIRNLMRESRDFP